MKLKGLIVLASMLALVGCGESGGPSTREVTVHTNSSTVVGTPSKSAVTYGENGLTVVNDKDKASSTPDGGVKEDHARFYKGSKLTFTGATYTKIVFEVWAAYDCYTSLATSAYNNGTAVSDTEAHKIGENDYYFVTWTGNTSELVINLNIGKVFMTYFTATVQ